MASDGAVIVELRPKVSDLQQHYFLQEMTTFQIHKILIIK